MRCRLLHCGPGVVGCVVGVEVEVDTIHNTYLHIYSEGVQHSLREVVVVMLGDER